MKGDIAFTVLMIHSNRFHDVFRNVIRCENMTEASLLINST